MFHKILSMLYTKVINKLYEPFNLFYTWTKKLHNYLMIIKIFITTLKKKTTILDIIWHTNLKIDDNPHSFFTNVSF